MTDSDVRASLGAVGSARHPDRIAMRVQGLDRWTGGDDRVQGVDFDIHRGELTAVMSRVPGVASGVMNAVTGLEPADAGSAEIAGIDMLALSGPELPRFRRAHIGYLFRSIDLAGSRTVVGNIRLPFDIDERPIGLDDARWLDRIVSTLGLASHLDRYPHELAPGLQQRVAIARALAPRPALVYGNEPCADLDERDGRAVLALLRTMAKEYDLGVALVTQDPDVGAAADRVVVLRDGRVAGEPRSMSSEEVASELSVAA